jgi:Xaa-Pro aminopeptidase
LNSIGTQLRPVGDLVGKIWTLSGRPAASAKPIVIHNFQYAGETIVQKLNRTTVELKRFGATTAIISALDEIAWLFNLRGNDIPYNPLFKSFAIVHANFVVDQPALFVHKNQLNGTSLPGVRIFDYAEFWSRLNATATNTSVNKIWASYRVSQAIFDAIPIDKLLQPLQNSPVQRVKARKNEVERKGMRECQIREAVARMKHLGWLEQQLNNDKFVNETHSAEQLIIYQQDQERFQFPSFSTISAVGDRAAIVHYSPEPATAQMITRDKIYLFDVRNISNMFIRPSDFFFYRGWRSISRLYNRYYTNPSFWHSD